MISLSAYSQFEFRHIRNLRESGAPVNKRIVIATAHGILKYYKPTMYKQLVPEVGDSWARSLMTRMGYSKRKGTVHYQ